MSRIWSFFGALNVGDTSRGPHAAVGKLGMDPLDFGQKVCRPVDLRA